MAGPVDASLRKFHASLNVSDLDRSVAFYRVLFGLDPAKVKRDYAKFELADPPLVLSLIPGRPGSGASAGSGHLNHAGLRVKSAEELIEIQHRLEAAGFPTKREEGVECCYSRQTKFWITDPDRALWEIYVFHEDLHDHGDDRAPHDRAPLEDDEDEVTAGASAAAVPVPLTLPPPKPRIVWTHRLTEPVPARIDADDNSVHEVQLEGSVNQRPDAPHRARLCAEAFRVLRPGASIQIHGLAGDRPSTQATLALPGPAADVQYVPTPAEVAQELVRAGFVDVYLETLSSTAYFVVDGVPMRELRMTARKPGHRPQTARHQAVYLGPLQQVMDDFGNVFRRGEPTPLNVHDWQVLSKSAASGAFLLLPPGGHERSLELSGGSARDAD